MKQLSGLDELLLAYEQNHQCMHVAALGIYDPSSVPGGHVRFRDIISHFRTRLDVAPVFRRRLVETPMGIDRAYWIDKGDVDLEYHVRHIALPHPGDWRQLCIQVARIHSRPLDRSKPLWEAYVIEGLNRVEGVPQGSFAVYVKFHSAGVEGESSAHMLRALHSMIASSESYSTMSPVVVDREPTSVELYARAVVNTVTRIPRFGRAAVSVALRLVGATAESLRAPVDQSRRKGLLGALGVPKRAPITQFRDKVSSHRAIECVGLPMESLMVVRKHVDSSTTNDLLLTILGGALRSYLSENRALPDESLIAGVPLAIGNSLPGAGSGSNLGIARVPLHTEMIDPIERLRAIQRDGRRARASANVFNRDVAKLLVEELPTAASEALIRRGLVGSMNIVVGDVRGPEVPLYLAGARLAQFCPLGFVVDGMGLSISALSYGGTLWVGVVSCRDMMPIPDVFARHLKASFDSLLRATEKVASRDRSTVTAVPRRRLPSRTRATPKAKAALAHAKSETEVQIPADSNEHVLIDETTYKVPRSLN